MNNNYIWKFDTLNMMIYALNRCLLYVSFIIVHIIVIILFYVLSFIVFSNNILSIYIHYTLYCTSVWLNCM